MNRKPSTGSLSLASPTSTGSTLRRAGSNCTTVSEFNMTSELMSISDSAHSRGFARAGSASGSTNDATFQRKGSTTLTAPQGVVRTESCPAVATAATFAAPDADKTGADADAGIAVDEAKPAGTASWPVKLPPARRHSSGYSPLSEDEVAAATAEAAAVMATAIAEAEAAAAAEAAYDEEASSAEAEEASLSAPPSPEGKGPAGAEVYCNLLTALVEADDELIDEVMTPIHAHTHGRHGSVMSLSMSLDYDDDLIALSGSEVRFTLPSLAEPVAPPVIDDLEKHPCARRQVSPLLKSLDELRSSGELQLEIPLITLED